MSMVSTVVQQQEQEDNDQEDLPLWLRELTQRLQSDDKALVEVNLNLRRLNKAMMRHLCRGLRKSIHLRSLNLTGSLLGRIDEPSREVVQPLLQGVLSASQASLSTSSLSSSRLQILHLSYNRLVGPLEGIRQTLATNQSLTELYLDHNRIECGTVEQLAMGLAQNRTLQVLQLSSNLIGDQGAQYLATALISNATVRTLGLSRNFIGPAGATALRDTLWKHKNITLTTLDVHNNPAVPSDTAGWITTLCRANRLGRGLLLFESPASLGLVPPVLARCRDAPSVLYLFLLEMDSQFLPEGERVRRGSAHGGGTTSRVGQSGGRPAKKARYET